VSKFKVIARWVVAHARLVCETVLAAIALYLFRRQRPTTISEPGGQEHIDELKARAQTESEAERTVAVPKLDMREPLDLVKERLRRSGVLK